MLFEWYRGVSYTGFSLHLQGAYILKVNPVVSSFSSWLKTLNNVINLDLEIDIFIEASSIFKVLLMGVALGKIISWNKTLKI